MVTIKEALTFDDVLMLPSYSNILPAETNISLNLTNQKFNIASSYARYSAIIRNYTIM